MVDMAHFAGPRRRRACTPTRCPHADVVTTTIHKTLGGARGGMILCREEHAKAINSAVFPGQQGGPLEHVIAGKAVALQDRARRERSASASSARSPAPRRVAAALLERRPRRQRPHRRHRRAPRRSSTCASPSSTASRPRTACTTSASRSTATRSRSTRVRRWSPAACASARRAGDARPAGRRLRRGRADHRHRADAGLRRPARRAGRARDGDRRPLPALRAPRRARRRRVGQRRDRLLRRSVGWRPMSEPDAVYAFVVRLRRRRGADAADRAARAARRRRRPAQGARAGRAARRRCSAAWRCSRGVLVAAALFLDFGGAPTDRFEGILAGAVVIALVGALDDRFDLPPGVKLAGQIVAAIDPRGRRRRGHEHHAAVRRRASTSATPAAPLTVVGARGDHERRQLLRRRRRPGRGRLRDRAVAFAIIAFDLRAQPRRRARRDHRRRRARLPGPQLPSGARLHGRLRLEPARPAAGLHRGRGRGQDPGGPRADLPARRAGRAVPRHDVRRAQADEVPAGRSTAPTPTTSTTASAGSASASAARCSTSTPGRSLLAGFAVALRFVPTPTTTGTSTPAGRVVIGARPARAGRERLPRLRARDPQVPAPGRDPPARAPDASEDEIDADVERGWRPASSSRSAARPRSSTRYASDRGAVRAVDRAHPDAHDRLDQSLVGERLVLDELLVEVRSAIQTARTRSRGRAAAAARPAACSASMRRAGRVDEAPEQPAPERATSSS